VELVWNNPKPNRTIDRPAVWEVTRRNGTTTFINTHTVQAVADRDRDDGEEEIFNDYLCF